MKNRTTLEQDMYCMFPTGLTQLQILELVDYILAEADVAFSEGYTRREQHGKEVCDT